MKKIAVVTPPKSSGGKMLAQALAEAGADVVRVPHAIPDRLNVGWGVGGGDLNNHLPPNKLWELEKCQAAKVPTVPFSRSMGQLVAGGGPNLVFGRAIKHTRGLDIVCYRHTGNGQYVVDFKAKKAQKPEFFTAVVPKKGEYRVHVFCGLAVRSGSKIKDPAATTAGGSKGHVWNLDHNYQIRYESPAPRGAKEVAKAAVKACGLDFAAVDIIEGTDGKFYVLELNTRPGLHGNTLTKYVEKIKLFAEGKIGRTNEDN